MMSEDVAFFIFLNDIATFKFKSSLFENEGKRYQHYPRLNILVRVEGLEPPRREALDPTAIGLSLFWLKKPATQV